MRAHAFCAMHGSIRPGLCTDGTLLRLPAGMRHARMRVCARALAIRPHAAHAGDPTARLRASADRHGARSHGKVARSMAPCPSLGPRARRSIHARIARPTLTRMLAPRSRACSPHARMLAAHTLDPLPCTRPTLALGPRGRGPQRRWSGRRWSCRQRPRRSQLRWARWWRSRWRRLWRRPWRWWRPLISQPAVPGTGARVSSGLSREGQRAAGS